MTESLESSSQGSSLIGAYREAASKQRIARRSITIAIIVTVLAFVFLIWSEVTDFRDNGMPEFGAELSAEATAFMPTVMEGVSDMTGRLVPVYIDNFSEVFTRDEDKYHAVLFDEFTKLEAYAQESWPKFEEALAQLVVDQEMAMSDALQGVVEPEQVEALSAAYRSAMEQYLEDFFANELASQTEVGEQIIAKLQSLSEEETDIDPQDTQAIFGMLLELLGMQMQEASVIEATLYQ